MKERRRHSLDRVAAGTDVQGSKAVTGVVAVKEEPANPVRGEAVLGMQEANAVDAVFEEAHKASIIELHAAGMADL